MLAKKCRKYILSHHLPKDYKRCIKFEVNNKVYLICSRCLGLYLGFIIFLPLFFMFQNFLYNINFILYLLPLPAIIDWSIHRFGIYQGTNSSRIATGFFLGVAYAGLLFTFIKNPLDSNFWIVIISYLIIGATIFKLTKIENT